MYETVQFQVQLLNALVAEQTEKQARLKQLRLEKAVVQTVQSETRQTADAAVQTDFPDIMEELKKQVASLTNIVAELTEFKAKQTSRPTPSTPPLYVSDSLCDSLISGIIDQEPVAAVDQSLLVPDQSVNPAVPTPDKLYSAVNQRPLVPAPPITDSTVPAPDKLLPAVNQRLLVPAPPTTDSAIPALDKLPPAVNQRLLVPAPPVIDSTVPASDQNRFMSVPVSSTSPYPQLRSPLSTIDTNAQVVFNNIDRGPTDDQKRKVEAIVLMSSQMVPSAMAAVNVLFSEEELANGNTSGTNGYKKLDGLKLCFLQSVLRRKHESETFTENWEYIKVKINTRCRGKRRTFLRRLQKQIDFN